jgi:xylulose-5-phosphate/fructose-6-phosphate phosphoketolase
LIHRLLYRRAGHGNIHVKGYIEEGTTTTPFDMTVRNRIDRYHLALDVVDRVPRLANHRPYVRHELENKLIDHKNYIEKHGEDLPDIRDWKWPY